MALAAKIEKNTIEQLELFESTETDILRRDIQKCIKSTDNLRKGIFSRHETLFELYQEIKSEIDGVLEQIEQLKIQLAAYETTQFVHQNTPKKRSKTIPFASIQS